MHVKNKEERTMKIEIKKIITVGLLCTSFSFAHSDAQEVQNFVERFYTKVLDRNADVSGLNSWTELLVLSEKSAADVARGFIFSDEFKSRKLDNNLFIKTLYQAFFNREAGTSEVQYWINKLTSGESKNI